MPANPSIRVSVLTTAPGQFEITFVAPAATNIDELAFNGAGLSGALTPGIRTIHNGVSSERTNETNFSMNALEALLNSVVLRGMISGTNATTSTAATAIQTALIDLRDYLSLIDVSRQLGDNGYTCVDRLCPRRFTGKTARTWPVERQLTVTTRRSSMSRNTTRRRIGKTAWVSTASGSTPTTTPKNQRPEDEFDDNDTTGETSILEIVYNVPGDALSPRHHWRVWYIRPARRTRPNRRSVTAALDNLDTVLHLFVLRGGQQCESVVGGGGDKTPESIRPAVNAQVVGDSALSIGVTSQRPTGRTMSMQWIRHKQADPTSVPSKAAERICIYRTQFAAVHGDRVCPGSA